MERLKQAVPTLMIITFALTMSLIVLAAIPYLQPPAESREPLEPSLQMVLLILSAGMLLIGYSMKGFLLRNAGSGGEKELSQYLGKFLTAHIVSLAVRESGVILAFVVSFLSGDPTWVGIAAGVGVVLNISDLPTEARVKATIPPSVLSQEQQRS